MLLLDLLNGWSRQFLCRSCIGFNKLLPAIYNYKAASAVAVIDKFATHAGDTEANSAGR